MFSYRDLARLQSEYSLHSGAVGQPRVALPPPDFFYHSNLRRYDDDLMRNLDSDGFGRHISERERNIRSTPAVQLPIPAIQLPIPTSAAAYQPLVQHTPALAAVRATEQSIYALNNVAFRSRPHPMGSSSQIHTSTGSLYPPQELPSINQANHPGQQDPAARSSSGNAQPQNQAGLSSAQQDGPGPTLPSLGSIFGQCLPNNPRAQAECLASNSPPQGGSPPVIFSNFPPTEFRLNRAARNGSNDGQAQPSPLGPALRNSPASNSSVQAQPRQRSAEQNVTSASDENLQAQSTPVSPARQNSTRRGNPLPRQRARNRSRAAQRNATSDGKNDGQAQPNSSDAALQNVGPAGGNDYSPVQPSLSSTATAHSGPAGNHRPRAQPARARAPATNCLYCADECICGDNGRQFPVAPAPVQPATRGSTYDYFSNAREPPPTRNAYNAPLMAREDSRESATSNPFSDTVATAETPGTEVESDETEDEAPSMGQNDAASTQQRKPKATFEANVQTYSMSLLDNHEEMVTRFLRDAQRRSSRPLMIPDMTDDEELSADDVPQNDQNDVAPVPQGSPKLSSPKVVRDAKRKRRPENREWTAPDTTEINLVWEDENGQPKYHCPFKGLRTTRMTDGMTPIKDVKNRMREEWKEHATDFEDWWEDFLAEKRYQNELVDGRINLLGPDGHYVCPITGKRAPQRSMMDNADLVKDVKKRVEKAWSERYSWVDFEGWWEEFKDREVERMREMQKTRELENNPQNGQNGAAPGQQDSSRVLSENDVEGSSSELPDGHEYLVAEIVAEEESRERKIAVLEWEIQQSGGLDLVRNDGYHCPITGIVTSPPSMMSGANHVKDVKKRLEIKYNHLAATYDAHDTFDDWWEDWMEREGHHSGSHEGGAFWEFELLWDGVYHCPVTRTTWKVGIIEGDKSFNGVKKRLEHTWNKQCDGLADDIDFEEWWEVFLEREKKRLEREKKERELTNEAEQQIERQPKRKVKKELKTARKRQRLN